MTITTKFELGQKVWIKELRTPAKVVAFFIGYDRGVQYSCRWFNSHDPKSAYFDEDEIGLPPENEIGFKTETKST